MAKADRDNTTTPSRRRALAMIAVGGATVAAVPATAAPVDPWLALKAEHTTAQAERERLVAIWCERMRDQPDDVGGGRARLYIDRRENMVLIGAEGLDVAVSSDMGESAAWGARLRAVLAAELAERQREIDATRARLGLAELDAQVERLAERVAILDGHLRQTEPTTAAGLAAKLRFLAQHAREAGCLVVSAQQLDGMAAAAAAMG